MALSSLMAPKYKKKASTQKMARSLCDFSHCLLAFFVVGGWLLGSSGRTRPSPLCLDNTPTKSSFHFELRGLTKQTAQQVSDFAFDTLDTGFIHLDFYTPGIHVFVHSIRYQFRQLLLDFLQDVIGSSVSIITEHLIMLWMVKNASTSL